MTHARTLREIAYNSLIKNSLFKISDVHPMIREEVVRQFLEAIIDDNRQLVKQLLDKHPELLITEPTTYDRNTFVIESKLTWQKFIAENGAIMAAKRKQIEMLALMLPYYDKLEQTETVKKAKADALSAWSSYKMSKNAQGEDEIVIPQEYAIYAQSLINVFSQEPCSNLDATGKFDPTKLSEQTESELSSLLNILLPKQAVKLDNYVDVELFLLVVYKAYWNENVLNQKQREAFCIRVLGLIQSALTPETAKFFCQSLDEVVTAIKEGQNIEISKEAMMHKLSSGESFYRKSRNDFSEGVGSKFVCMACFVLCGKEFWRHMGVLEYLCHTKTSNLENILRSKAQNRNRAACNRLK